MSFPVASTSSVISVSLNKIWRTRDAGKGVESTRESRENRHPQPGCIAVAGVVVATWLSILNESEIPYARKTKESYPDLFSSLSRLADNCEIKGSG